VPLDSNRNIFPHLITTNFTLISHHDTKRLSGLGRKVQKVDHAILDKVMGTTPMNEDHDIVPVNGTINTQCI